MKLKEKIYLKKRDGTFYTDETKEKIYKKLDNFNIEQVKHYLKIFDRPWIPEQWENLLRKFPNQPILGRYLSLCMLKGYRDFSYADSEWMREMRETKYFYELQRQIQKTLNYD